MCICWRFPACTQVPAQPDQPPHSMHGAYTCQPMSMIGVSSKESVIGGCMSGSPIRCSHTRCTKGCGLWSVGVSPQSCPQVVTGLQSLLEHADSAGKRSSHSAGQEAGLSTPQHKSCRDRTLYQQRCQPAPRALQPIYGMPLKQQLDSYRKTGARADWSPCTVLSQSTLSTCACIASVIITPAMHCCGPMQVLTDSLEPLHSNRGIVRLPTGCSQARM